MKYEYERVIAFSIRLKLLRILFEKYLLQWWEKEREGETKQIIINLSSKILSLTQFSDEQLFIKLRIYHKNIKTKKQLKQCMVGLLIVFSYACKALERFLQKSNRTWCFFTFLAIDQPI